MDDEAAAETKAYEVVDENEEENKEEPGENIAEAAEKAAAEAEASGTANPDEEVKISLTDVRGRGPGRSARRGGRGGGECRGASCTDRERGRGKAGRGDGPFLRMSILWYSAVSLNTCVMRVIVELTGVRESASGVLGAPFVHPALWIPVR